MLDAIKGRGRVAAGMSSNSSAHQPLSAPRAVVSRSTAPMTDLTGWLWTGLIESFLQKPISGRMRRRVRLMSREGTSVPKAAKVTLRPPL